MERIKSVDVFGIKYKINWVDSIKNPESDDVFYYGLSIPAVRTIVISLTDLEGKPLPESIIEQTFLHELVHSVLCEGGYDDLSAQEPLVVFLSRVLHPLIKKNILN